MAFIYAGDACRVAGQYEQALQYYERLLALPVGTQAKGASSGTSTARPANIQAIKLFDTLDLGRVPDGTYRSASLGYEADVQVEVAVQASRIESVRVTEHREKQFYSALTDTPRKIIAKQSVKGIDATSSATITSEAIINATAKALSGAMKESRRSAASGVSLGMADVALQRHPRLTPRLAGHCATSRTNREHATGLLPTLPSPRQTRPAPPRLGLLGPTWRARRCGGSCRSSASPVRLALLLRLLAVHGTTGPLPAPPRAWDGCQPVEIDAEAGKIGRGDQPAADEPIAAGTVARNRPRRRTAVELGVFRVVESGDARARA